MAKSSKSEPTPQPAPRKTEPDGGGFTCIYRPTYSHTLLSGVDKGDAEALYQMGRLEFEGREAQHTTVRYGEGGKHVVSSYNPGIERNALEAERLLQQAADKGHEGARRLLEVVKLGSRPGIH